MLGGGDPPAVRAPLQLGHPRTMIAISHVRDLFPMRAETAGIFPRRLHLVIPLGISGRLVPDARLVAVLEANGVNHVLARTMADVAHRPMTTANRQRTTGHGIAIRPARRTPYRSCTDTLGLTWPRLRSKSLPAGSMRRGAERRAQQRLVSFGFRVI